MNYTIFVGLDVHKSSISACAIDIETGEIKRKRFDYDACALATWLSALDKPFKVVYESGFCGFHLYRELELLGIPCIIAAISKLQKPSGDKIKTDKRDAEFLARQLAAGNISGIYVPTLEMEGYRDIARVYESVCDELKRFKQRIDKCLLRYGLRYTKTKSQRTKSYLEWIKKVQLPTVYAQHAFEIDLQMLISLTEQKEALIRKIESYCGQDVFKETVDGLITLIGIKKVTAFRLICEVGSFSRFKNAKGFACYLGLVPSEYSSGMTTHRGRITKCGNKHLRKLLVEISWSINRAKNAYKDSGDSCTKAIENHAQKGNRRLMGKRRALKAKNKPANVCNVASARELSMWIWAIACMVKQKAA